MLLRRCLVAAAAATIVGCAPSVPPPNGSTAPVTYVVFDPAAQQVPLPNDLAWMQAPTGAPRSAQDELAQLFAAQQGFPNDQEVPITIDVQQWTVGTSNPAKSAPAAGLDPTTLTTSTFLFLERPAGAQAFQPVAPGSYDVEYAASADRGTISVRNHPDPTTGSRRWRAGSQYALVLRGGANGAKLGGGVPLTSMPTLYLLTRGVDLSLPENEYLLSGTRDERAAAGRQLEALRQQYLPLFAAAEATPPAGFGWGEGASQDIVSVQTFTIAAAQGTQVVADESAGVMPLPSDFLLDPVTGKIVNNPAFGPLAPGIATLDGFSTTALILAQTSGPVAVEKINKDTVYLYELSKTGPVRVKELFEGAGAGFVAEPLVLGKTLAGDACTAAAGCFSTAIGLQPAVPASTGSDVVALPALKEATEYAILITNDVLAVNATGTPPLAPLAPTSLGRLLLFSNPLVDSSGKSQIAGQSDATAAGLEQMRRGVSAAAAALATEKGIGKDRIAMAYTFRTQSMSQTIVDLAAAPYAQAQSIVPGTPIPLCGGPDPSPACASGTGLPLPLPAVSTLLVVPTPTLNPIDPATGALNAATSAWTPLLLNAYVFVPASTTALPDCPAPAAALKCAPLVIFKHGLTRSKDDVFALANQFAAAGFVVAAIDAPLHGDRSYCTDSSQCVCPPWAAGCTARCQLFPTPQPTDPVPAGLCSDGSVANTAAVPGGSGGFILTQNFFRSRDALREDVLDTSALILALAPTTPASNSFTAALAAHGVAIAPSQVSLLAFSMGGTHGVMSLAANPRIGRAVFTSAGGTTMDIVTTGSFSDRVAPLLGTPGTQAFLTTLQIAKWILDPAEPLNFARHLLGDTLASPLTSGQAQAPKSVFGQYPICDETVPNPFEIELYAQIGLAPVPTTTANAFKAYDVGSSTLACANAHSFLLDPADASGVQADAANYLLHLVHP